MIHQFSLFGEHFTLDVNSSSLHIADEKASRAIALLENSPKEDYIKKMTSLYPNDSDISSDSLESLYKDIMELKQQGKLYTEFSYRDYIKAPETKQLKALCLNVAHTCNLCCSYCFAAEGNFKDGTALMSFDVAKQAVDFLIENSGSHYNLDIDFFGGEPLLNFDVVKQTVAYARKIEKEKHKNFRFTFTTNGVLLNDNTIDYLNENMHNVVLSLDGRKEVHDRFRVNAKGRGSYDTVVPNFIKFAEKRRPKEFYIRATFTRHNLDFFKDILHMLDLGFTELSMEPVVAPLSSPESIREEDLPEVFIQYELLAKEMIKRSHEGNPFEFYHFNIDLEEGPCAYKLIAGCGTGCEYLAVTPSGELYPCHQFVGDKHFLMGDVFSGIKNKNLRMEFAENNLYEHKECDNCWAKYFCAGGCAANNFHSSGNIAGTYKIGCEIFKKRLECALAVNALK